MIRFFSGTAMLAVALAGFLPASRALAHITFETRQAPVDSRYKAVLRVPHGCKGSATVKLRVRIPEGVIGVKPQPKPGWTLNIVKGDYAQAYSLYKAKVASGVKEISWSGNLPDDEYDEFVFVGHLSDTLKPGSTLYFPVVQECQQGVQRWIDLPGPDGKAARDHADFPAPGLLLLPRP
jgi:uncharacterized protein YcnI